MVQKIRIDQIDLALIQLERACELFFLKDFVCSVTLAGAAEELLGSVAEMSSKKVLGKNKKERGINSLNINAGMMEFFGVAYGQFKQKHNRIRNELKHPTDNFKVDIKDIEIKAIEYIAAGITNHKLITGAVPDMPQISRFCKEIGVT